MKLKILITGGAGNIARGDMSRRCPDNSKMKNILNRLLKSLEEGVKKMMCSYQKQEK
jgi:UDP-glucose 4-epimerase